MAERRLQAKRCWRRASHVAAPRNVVPSGRRDHSRALDAGVREPTHVAAELSRAQRLLDAAHQARAAAEEGRNRAERARNAAEGVDDATRRAQAVLQEQVAFFEEQMRSTRLYFTEFVQVELLFLHAQRDELLHDVRLLSEELRARERAEARSDLSTVHTAMHDAPRRSVSGVRRSPTEEDLARNWRWANGSR